MRNLIFFPIKQVKNYIKSNLRLYIINILIVVMGIILGIYFVLSDMIDDIIYTGIELELSEIILGEKTSLSLFFLNLKVLVLPMIIIFLLFTNKYTGFLSYFYIGYQGILLGSSITSVMMEAGVAGILNTLLIILPVNLLNFFILISFTVICYKRLMLARLQKLSFSYSIRLCMKSIVGCVCGALFSSFIYGFIYPLLLKTAIVVSV